jgi:hypothetical protein
MVAEAEKEGAQRAEDNDPWISIMGKFICKFRIDELPQLWNVFKSEASFIRGQARKTGVYSASRKGNTLLWLVPSCNARYYGVGDENVSVQHIS